MAFQRSFAVVLFMISTNAWAQVGVEEEAKQLKTSPHTVQKPPQQSAHPAVRGPVQKAASSGPGVSLTTSAEDWKGTPPGTDYSFAVMTGLGILSDQVGLPLLGTLSRKIMNEGFLADINDPISLEAAFGPMFIKGSTAWLWSAHMRWDFIRDDQFSLFGLGGIGGNFIPTALGKRQEFFPRVGVGMFYGLSSTMKLRVEVGHEWVAAGVGVSF